VRDVLASQPGVVRTGLAATVEGKVDLRGEDDVLAVNIAVLEPLADPLLAGAVGIAVDVRGVDEVDPVIPGGVEQFVGLLAVGFNGAVAFLSKRQVPKQSLETVVPVLPSVVYSMGTGSSAECKTDGEAAIRRQSVCENLEVVDSLEVVRIVRHDRNVVDEGRRSDHHVRVFDRCPVSLQCRVDFSGSHRALSIEWEFSNVGEQVFHHPPLLFGRICKVNSFPQLHHRHRTHPRYGALVDRPNRLFYRFLASEYVHEERESVRLQNVDCNGTAYGLSEATKHSAVTSR